MKKTRSKKKPILDNKKVIEEKTISKYGILINVGIVIIILTPFFMFGHYQQKALEKNGVYTTAVIYKLTSAKASKGNPKIYYSFSVDGIKHKGNGRLYPRRDTFFLGDTIVIIYDRTNPSNNTTKRDFIFIHWWE